MDEDRLNSTTDLYRYEPINTYQTRLLQLHGDAGDTNAPILCTLYVADLLNSAFDGLGLRSKNGDKDHLVGYEALSYTWGDEGLSKTIECNGAPLHVTNNLFGALLALRHSGESFRYLWIDAVCIDQKSDIEKAFQVRNMFAIYEGAVRVVAWLGESHEGTADMLSWATSSDTAWNLDRVCEALENLYTRPWFRRMWVQQEIFAARKIVFQCGSHQFSWTQPLSNPGMLLKHPRLAPYQKSLDELKKDKKQSHVVIPVDVQTQQANVLRLTSLHDHRLACFENIRQSEVPRLDLIDTLLQTSVLEAKNPRDYIYGILGMTGLLARPMSIQEWIIARQSESQIFIPIDYSADLNAIYSTVTWAILMTEGLGSLAHIMPQPRSHTNTGEASPPSWAIDWKAAAEVLQRNTSPYIVDHELSLTGELRRARKLRIDISRETIPGSGRRRGVSKGDRQSYVDTLATQLGMHKQFCNDNRTAMRPYNKLVVQGIIDHRFVIKGRYIYLKRGILLKDSKFWSSGFDIFPTDVLLSPAAIVGDYAVHIRGPWLLRPAGAGEYYLVACLNMRFELATSYSSPWALELSATGQQCCFTARGIPALEDYNYLYTTLIGRSSPSDLRTFILV